MCITIMAEIYPLPWKIIKDYHKRKSTLKRERERERERENEKERMGAIKGDTIDVLE